MSDLPLQSQKCGRCGQEKCVSQFYLDKRRRRRRTTCTECIRLSPTGGKRTPLQRAEYRRTHGKTTAPYVPLEDILSRAAARRGARHNAHVAAWYAFTRRQNRKPEVGSKRWYALATPEAIASYQEGMRLRYRRRYIASPEAERLRVKVYKHANPTAVAKWGDKRRRVAAERSDGSLTRNAVKRLFACAKTCPYCGIHFDADDKTLDHVIALARGGSHSIRNALVCCKSCNAKKQAKDLARWLAEIGIQRAAAVLRLMLGKLDHPANR
jgi:5-methylcytosine-specific restriction endonuclease McrA